MNTKKIGELTDLEKGLKLGFIGQGFVGKTYADYYERRGFNVTRYSLEKEYVHNRDKINDCHIVFIAVNTPTTKTGFDFSALVEVLQFVGEGNVAVIRSTLLPGTTEKLQEIYPNIILIHVPEFLTARLAFEEAVMPKKNIIGIAKDTFIYQEKAKLLLSIMPAAAHRSIVPVKEAEYIKYMQNNFMYVKNIYMSIFYKHALKLGLNIENIASALLSEPMMGTYHHMDIETIKKVGFGAGGECLLKDFEAFLQFYKAGDGEESGAKVLEAIRDRNIELLTTSGKDIDIREKIYGKAA